MRSILTATPESFNGAIAMPANFNSLPEAQAYARTMGITKYYRVHFTDSRTREMKGQGGWKTQAQLPTFRIYMDLKNAIECIESRHRGTTDRTEIETLWTEDVSDYLADKV